MNFNYSQYWFNNASLQELVVEREKVRLAWCNPQYTKKLKDYEIYDLQELLWKFDEYMRKKEYITNSEANNLPKHQHGWYLPEDDD